MITKGIETVILAGGKGERMGNFCNETQKCLLLIDDLPILQHIMETLIKAFGTVSLKAVLSYKAAEVKDYIERNKPGGMEVEYFFDAGEGTYGAYKEIEDFIKNPLFVGIPGDIIVPPETYQSVYETSLSGKLPAVLTFSSNVEEADSHALGVIKGARVLELFWPFEDKKINKKEECVRHMNIYGFSKEVFSLMNLFPPDNGILTQVLMNSLDSGVVLGGLISRDRWLHVAYKEDLNKKWINEP